MVLSNTERQARYRQRLRNAAYEHDLLRQQIAALGAGLNEARAKLGLAELQLPKSADEPRR
jgi:ABC-type arginine/histidine transport system permease subunit